MNIFLCKLREMFIEICYFSLHVFSLLIALYLTYGWLTISDIQAECKKRGLDPEEVLESLLIPAPIPQRVTKKDGSVEHTLIFPEDLPFLRRLRADHTVVSVSVSGENNKERSEGNSSKLHNAGFIPRPDGGYEYTIGITSGGNSIYESSVRVFAPLLPFLLLSQNTMNFLFCFGLASLASYTIIIARFLRGKTFSRTYLLLKPLLAGLASALGFVVLQAGGTMIWSQIPSPNGVSLGLMSIAAALYCEQLPELLKFNVFHNMQKI